MERKLVNGGIYFVRCDKPLLEKMKKDERVWQKIMAEEMVKRLREWLDLLVEKIDTRKIVTIAMPGN